MPVSKWETREKINNLDLSEQELQTLVKIREALQKDNSEQKDYLIDLVNKLIELKTNHLSSSKEWFLDKKELADKVNWVVYNKDLEEFIYDGVSIWGEHINSMVDLNRWVDSLNAQKEKLLEDSKDGLSKLWMPMFSEWFAKELYKEVKSLNVSIQDIIPEGLDKEEFMLMLYYSLYIKPGMKSYYVKFEQVNVTTKFNDAIRKKDLYIEFIPSSPSLYTRDIDKTNKINIFVRDIINADGTLNREKLVAAIKIRFSNKIKSFRERWLYETDKFKKRKKIWIYETNKFKRREKRWMFAKK